MVVTSTPLEGISLKDIFAATADSELPADEVPVSKDDAIMTENTKRITRRFCISTFCVTALLWQLRINSDFTEIRLTVK